MPAAKVGYVRVSSEEQSAARQLSDMTLDRVFEEKRSGKSASDRPVLKEMIAYVREGDELFVHSMDRLARNLEDLLKLVNVITSKGVTIHFVKEHLTFSRDTENAPMSKLLLSVMGAVAEFERALIRERQREGIEQAKRRGVYKGRKPMNKDTQKRLLEMRAQGLSVATIAKELQLSVSTVYKYLDRANHDT